MGQSKSGYRSILEELFGGASGRARRPEDVLELKEFDPIRARDLDAASAGLRPADEGIFPDPVLAAADPQSTGSSASLSRLPSAVTSIELRGEPFRFDEGTSLVHELLRPGFGSTAANTCRCPGCSRLFVTDGTTGSGAAVAAASLDLGLTFKLHSNPNANHTIYLDFDGYSLASSQWENGGALQVGSFYSSLTDPAVQQAIQDIWRRVSEDFSPFNINVTTEAPSSEDLKKSSSGDTRWGIRVAMTTNINLSTNRAIRNAGGGGTAYLGSFNWATDDVCLVFNGYNGTDTDSIYAAAETVSHEVGHTLGLRHDGGSYGRDPNYYEGDNLTGVTSWGPIMGAPFIGNDENVTTWSKGDYIGANNREDDLGIITGSVSNAYVNGNGFTYRVDDYGNDATAAYFLGGTAPSSFGIIERNTDVDWFRFSTGTGDISLSISNACRVFISNVDGTFSTQDLESLGPNLDISATIYNAGGIAIATSNPLDRLDASFNLSLAAGDYYLSVEGVGFGTPLANPPSGYTDYASLGQYLISGTFIDRPPGLIVTPTGGLTTTESGGTALFSVALSQAPTMDVVISVVSGNTSEGTVSPSSLTFTSTNWNTAQTVTVTGQDDPVIDGPTPYTVSLNSASGDPDYDGLNSSVSLTNFDNDLVVSLSPVASTVVEGQVSSVTYTVALSSGNHAGVTVNYATANGSATAGSDYTAASGTLSFAAGETSKTITVNLLNDSANEEDETFLLSLLSPTNAILGSASSATTTLTDTLVTSVTTSLPAGIENLRLDGIAAINGTGNSGANMITGNGAANVLKGGGGIDTITGLGGNDIFDLSGISSAANRCTITDFNPTGETIWLSNSLTSRSGTSLSSTTVAQGSTVTLNTTNSDLFFFNFANAEADVNLANSTNGTALLDGLNTASSSASLNTSSSRGRGYILAYDNDNAYLYSFNAGSNSAVSASEIALIGILDSSSAISVGSLISTNFVLV